MWPAQYECDGSAYWWDGEYEGRCELQENHWPLPHWDGVSWFNDDNEPCDHMGTTPYTPTMTDHTHLTSIETQLISRSRPYDPTQGWTGRWLHLAHNSPREELEAAAALVEKGYIRREFSGGAATWYDLTTRGLAYRHAAWPNRRD